MTRLWEEADQQAAYDPCAQQREKAWRQHERYIKRFGPNYQKVLDERRTKRKRKAEVARQELADRTCSICGLVCSKPSAVKVHKALEHRARYYMDDEAAIDFLKSKGWVLDWVRGGPGLIPPQRKLDAEEERAAAYLQEQHDYVIGG